MVITLDKRVYNRLHGYPFLVYITTITGRRTLLQSVGTPTFRNYPVFIEYARFYAFVVTPPFLRV